MIDELQAEIAKLRDDLGEALVRENNLRAALEAALTETDNPEARRIIKAALAKQ